MDSEQTQNFNDRLSQWVSSQGFWFQIRYSMSTTGSGGTAMYHVLSLGLKVLVFLALVAAGSWVYLAKRTATERFSVTLKEGLQSGLGLTDIRLGGHKREGGQLMLTSLSGSGGEDAFFSWIEAKNIRAKMGFFDGMAGQWDLGTLSVTQMEIDLRAGADDEAGAAKIGEAWFRTPAAIKCEALEVSDATLRWGYRKAIASTGQLQLTGSASRTEFSAQHTRGAIENSHMKMQRQDGLIRLSFKGGTFTQNWLQRLEIVDLVVLCDREGLTFETAEFKRGKGTVSFSGLKVAGGARPAVDGTLKVSHLDLAAILPGPFRSVVEGSISGDFKVGGSTNEVRGITLAGNVTLGEGDMISLRDRLPLLQALTMADYSRNYRRVDFREGSFHLACAAGGAEFSDVSLKSDDLLTVNGKLAVRLPQPGESIPEVVRGAAGDDVPVFNSEESEEPAEETDDITLRRAGQNTSQGREGLITEVGKGPAPGGSPFARMNLGYEARRSDEKSASDLARALRFSGSFRISILPDAFARAPRLLAEFPVDPALGRIPMVVPLEGAISQLTVPQAEFILQSARR